MLSYSFSVIGILLGVMLGVYPINVFVSHSERVTFKKILSLEITLCTYLSCRYNTLLKHP